jgi:hypothetical protein
MRHSNVRVWDLSPGYLSRQSLLGEHRELHGLRSILMHGKRGYARHPETLRWVGCLSGLERRHDDLAAEMRLRGYVDRTPVPPAGGATVQWPASFIDAPSQQIALLEAKYLGKSAGRIPLPSNAQELWAHHKYSVMARDPDLYREIGRRVSRMRPRAGFSALATELVMALRETPSAGRLANALDHMWGYVRDAATDEERQTASRGAAGLINAIQTAAVRCAEPYLLASTALADLAVCALNSPNRQITKSPNHQIP